MTSPASRASEPRRVHPWIEKLAAYGWRLIVLSAVLAGVVWLLGQLWVPLFALTVAIFVARVLDLPVSWLRERGVPSAAAALLALVVLFGSLGLAGWALAPGVAEEFDGLGPTLTTAVDDVENWLVTDAPVALDQADVDRFRRDAGDAVSTTLRSSGGSLINGAVLVIELIAGLLLAIISAFFLLKDGPRFQSWVLRRVPSHRRADTSRLAARAWRTIGGYLRGAALLGVIESVIIGIAMAIVGADLIVPVMLLTFVAAFVPIVGAVVAGVVAVLLVLSTAGFADAVVVAIVAIVVQQLDGDLLAPAIYGQTLQMHPLTILFAIVSGGALFGFAGTVLAVPVTAVILNVAAEAGIGRPVDEVEASAEEAGVR